jgi:ribonuclease PH
MTKRLDNRKHDELRRIRITRDFLRYPDGSVLIECGETKVICTAIIDEYVPNHRKGSGLGWVSAEYSMIPGSTAQRAQRESHPGKVKGRTLEIQRLVGRSLRSIVDMEILGERSILIDCDVIQADGGTRTASITGAFVAMHDAIKKLLLAKKIEKSPIKEFLAATSVGIIKGEKMLDLAYSEDSAADVDMNIVMTESGKFVEVQGTAEMDPFSKEEMDALLDLGAKGIKELVVHQHKALGA